MANSKSDALACPKGAAEPRFVNIHKPLETFEFREPYRIRRVQSFGEKWAFRRRMSRLCRLEVRSSNEKSLLLLGLIANKFAQRIQGCGQAGGAGGIRTGGTKLSAQAPQVTNTHGRAECTYLARGDSVAILNKQKAALTSGPLLLSCNFSYLFGCGDRI
jgi:hypothetical protein